MKNLLIYNFYVFCFVDSVWQIPSDDDDFYPRQLHMYATYLYMSNSQQNARDPIPRLPTTFTSRRLFCCRDLFSHKSQMKKISRSELHSLVKPIRLMRVDIQIPRENPARVLPSIVMKKVKKKYKKNSSRKFT